MRGPHLIREPQCYPLGRPGSTHEEDWDNLRQLNFHDHRRELGDNLYVYPVISRRAGGLSVGVNLNPDKVCNLTVPTVRLTGAHQAARGRLISIG